MIPFITVLATLIGARAQQPMSPATQPTQPPSAERTPPVTTNTLPPGRAFNLTNPPPGRPFGTNPPPGRSFNQNSNFSGRLTPGAAPTNQPGTTNALTQPGANRVNFSITNTLANMAAAQATNVYRFQASLKALQQLSVNISPTQTISQTALQNPQLQQQLQLISAQINALAQGPSRPSPRIVQRLSEDLVAACGGNHLAPDRQLVLAIIINQAVNSAGISPPLIERSIDDARAVLVDAGVPLAVAHPVTCDLHSVAYELQAAAAPRGR